MFSDSLRESLTSRTVPETSRMDGRRAWEAAAIRAQQLASAPPLRSTTPPPPGCRTGGAAPRA
jgi:hypothetical protein